ncbi:hypothetical protein [Peristeroidobacter soli]|jgi:hypothetical protein|uniref:hypothetical protein n=1 Tax=Peristeroidobacter soli TaxID=2497877 RepID=UPI00101C10DB|nr:hypothetical protein [Peristeroidobacter soli]
MRSVTLLAVPAILALLAGCGEQRGPTVYVLEGTQSVELKASASPAKVQPGGQVVLHVERRTTGQWKKIGRNELTPGQCWVYRPPVELEPEVAHDVQWAVEPENSLEFHSEYQLDQSRVATVRGSGKISAIPVSKVKCEEGRVVEGAPVEIDAS